MKGNKNQAASHPLHRQCGCVARLLGSEDRQYGEDFRHLNLFSYRLMLRGCWATPRPRRAKGRVKVQWKSE
jgi:hypothetical protein